MGGEGEGAVRRARTESLLACVAFGGIWLGSTVRVGVPLGGVVVGPTRIRRVGDRTGPRH